MKKLIAIAVVFTLLVPFAFAVDVDAGGVTKITAVQVDTDGNEWSGSDEPFAGDAEAWFWFGAGKVNDDNTAGFKVGLSFGMAGENAWSLSTSADDTWAYGWWQPIEQLFFKLGKVGENGRYWAGAGILGWDLHSNDLITHPQFSWYNGFAGGILGDSHAFFSNGLGNTHGFQMSILPIDGLALNFGARFQGQLLENFADTIALQAVYEIAGIGKAALGFRNGGEYDNKEIAVQWNMPIGSAMKLEAGVKYLVEPKDAKKNPIDIGVGFGYGSPWGDQFWVNARVGVRLGIEDGDENRFGIDVVPSYDLGLFRIYVPVGVAVVLPDEGDSLLAWNFSPYVRKDLGGITLWGGFIIHNGGLKGTNITPANKDNVRFAIPLAIQWAW